MRTSYIDPVTAAGLNKPKRTTVQGFEGGDCQFKICICTHCTDAMRWFISIRYLLTHLRQSLVCIAGVTISVMMFITMTSMMQRVHRQVHHRDGRIVRAHHDQRRAARDARRRSSSASTPTPTRCSSSRASSRATRSRRSRTPTGLIATLRRMPGIVAVAPHGRRRRDRHLRHEDATSLSVLGVEPEQQVARHHDRREGHRRATSPASRRTADGIVLGRGIARRLGATIDDIITLSSPTGGRTTAKVVGIFDTGVTPVDYCRAYMLLNDAQTLLDKKNIINEIIIRTDDYTQGRELADADRSRSAATRPRAGRRPTRTS